MVKPPKIFDVGRPTTARFFFCLAGRPFHKKIGGCPALSSSSLWITNCSHLLDKGVGHLSLRHPSSEDVSAVRNDTLAAAVLPVPVMRLNGWIGAAVADTALVAGSSKHSRVHHAPTTGSWAGHRGWRCGHKISCVGRGGDRG